MENTKIGISISEKKLLTPLETMPILGVSRSTMYEILLKDPSFPVLKIGRKYFINKQGLQSWIDKQCS
ncbi:helix-turn-helix domain-containing protein [Clostridium botulinum]|uniref:helix-turn-helix domain-containing protein n=1 Tax=Clostridium botulinum TaxID=1491 RepID=UPI0007748423|nr:helix-turn-helix domain-containing protein [Clostridium botulinum]NFL86822.1 helix-turn-helix domain-containing protein [Clostridium botulinum]NFO21848.1 helix-turn-helix domain-containing protein [Clostridium botulinum]